MASAHILSLIACIANSTFSFLSFDVGIVNVVVIVNVLGWSGIGSDVHLPSLIISSFMILVVCGLLALFREQLFEH